MQDFTSKRNALFASLDDASKELRGTALDQSGLDTSTINILKRSSMGNLDMVYREETGGVIRQHNNNSHSPDRSLSRMRGKESIFKKPELPIGKCLKPRKTPDYQVNPHKWKKYSLSDVDISDQTNNSAAFAFLKQMDEQRETEAESESSVINTNTKIEFKKSSKIKRHLAEISKTEVADEEIDKPKLKGSKLVMPEYIIGQRLEKKKKNTSQVHQQQVKTKKQLTLSHLQDNTDDVDDDIDDVEN